MLYVIDLQKVHNTFIYNQYLTIETCFITKRTSKLAYTNVLYNFAILCLTVRIN